jgi:hypothetical protein
MVKAASTANANISNVAIVTVPQVSSVVITNATSLSATRHNSNRTSFAATVTFDGEPPAGSGVSVNKGVTWSVVSGNTPTLGTAFASNGLLVPLAETSRTIRIRATSIENTTKYAEADVKIPLIVDASKTSLKDKFGVEATDATGVTRTFNMLSQYIKEGGLGANTTKTDGTIKMGDYIDLASLYVGDHVSPGVGSINMGINSSVTSGTLLRLIVVGINSFNGKNGNNTPHVVFQFQNVPGTYFINRFATPTPHEYTHTNMRTYLSDKYMVGLKNAGVPESVLWPPVRKVWSGNESNFVTLIADLLWLPTAYEMGANDGTHPNQSETQDNQVRLSYYEGNASRRKKYNSSNDATSYWTASVWGYSRDCTVINSGGSVEGAIASDSNHGVAPAFCVY